MTEIVLYTGKSPLKAPLILWDTETPLSDNPLMTSIGQEYRSLNEHVEHYRPVAN